MASNDLDEHLIESLKHQGAKISVWGVGTQMVTGGAQSALGGVYKLGAIRNDAGEWEPKIKLSEQAIKVSNPGVQQVRRFTVGGEFVGDAIFDEEEGCRIPVEIVHPSDPTRTKTMPDGASHEDLLQPVYRGGELVAESPALTQIQKRTREQLTHLHATVKRLQHPHEYPAGVERTLHERKLELIRKAKQS